MTRVRQISYDWVFVSQRRHEENIKENIKLTFMEGPLVSLNGSPT